MFPSLKKTALLSCLVLASTAQACLEVTGHASTGLGLRVNLKFVDNGVTVIDAGKDKASGTLSGNSGYSVDYDWGATAGPIHVVYKTPHGNFEFDVNNTGCGWMNCCGGTIPCSCGTCEFKTLQYGC